MLNPSETSEFFGFAQSVTEIVTPWLPLAGIIAGGIILGAFNAHNRRKGNVEERAPDVNEIWQREERIARQLDAERKWRRRIQNYAWEVINVFRAYVRRVQNGGSADLTPHEKLFYDSEPPSEEITIKTQ